MFFNFSKIRALDPLTSWIKSNHYRFRLSDKEDLDLFTTAKPLAELSFVLAGLVNFGHHDDQWVKELILYFQKELESIERSSYWDRLWEKIDDQDIFGEILQLFLQLEILSGKQFSYHKQIYNYLKKKIISPNPKSLAFRYTAELAGIGSCEKYAKKEIQLFLLKYKSQSIISRSDLYHLTHAIFYGSKMGIRNINWQQLFPNLPQALKQYMHNSLKKNDLDLAAELLFCTSLLKIPFSDIELLTAQRLKENICTDLSNTIIQGNLFCHGDYFSRQYHLVLATILALYTTN